MVAGAIVHSAIIRFGTQAGVGGAVFTINWAVALSPVSTSLINKSLLVLVSVPVWEAVTLTLTRQSPLAGMLPLEKLRLVSLGCGSKTAEVPQLDVEAFGVPATVR